MGPRISRHECREPVASVVRDRLAGRSAALRLIAEALHDGTWKAHALKWITHFSWPPFWAGKVAAQAVEVRASLIAKLLTGDIDDAAHAVLPGIFNTPGELKEASRIAEWLVQKAEPNDATMVADVVEHLLRPRDRQLDDECFALVQWLMTRGSSELRSPRRALMVSLELLPFVVSRGTPAQIAVAIRYALYGGKPVEFNHWVPNAIKHLLTAIEAVVVWSGSGSIVGDLVAALDEPALELYVHNALVNDSDYRCSRAEVVRRLTTGELPTRSWQKAVRGRVVDCEMATADIARAAADGLIYGMRELAAHGGELLPHGTDWGRRIAAEMLRMTSLLHTKSEQDVRRLQQCAAFDRSVWEGVHQSVLLAVENELPGDPTLHDVRAVLISPGTEQSVVFAALELLHEQPPRPLNPEAASIDHMLEAIARALQADFAPICGFAIDRVTKAKTARTGMLENERAFAVEGNELVVSASVLQELLRVSDDAEVQRALGVMYVVHELVHDVQGVAEKRDVSRVRFAGAESALMHIDLGADHLAAMTATAVFPGWDLLWLEGSHHHHSPPPPSLSASASAFAKRSFVGSRATACW